MTTLEKDKQYLIQCYTTDDIVFTNGKGMYMYDEGEKSIWIFPGSFPPVHWDTAMKNSLRL